LELKNRIYQFDFRGSLYNGSSHHYSQEFFTTLLMSAKDINFNDEYFGVQTKVRSRIKNILYIVCELKTINELKMSEDEQEHLVQFLARR
jgi:hypothetical protein